MSTPHPETTTIDKSIAMARRGAPAEPEKTSSKEDASQHNRRTILTTFAIDSDNNITAFTTAVQPDAGFDRFATEKDLAKLSSGWPMIRFAEVWNAFAGVASFDSLKPVKRFTYRRAAVSRIWKAIQPLAPSLAPQAAHVAQKKDKGAKGVPGTAQAPTRPKIVHAARVAKANNAPATARQGSKKAMVINMLKRPDGTTLQDILDAMDWQSHTVRGLISGGLTKKMGLEISSAKRGEGQRIYRLER